MPKAIFEKLAKRMEGAIDHLKKELSGLRSGRASLSLLDRVMVNYYGTQTPLKQVGNLSLADRFLITIQPWNPSIIKDIEKSIATSDLSLTPSNDGKIIRLPIPPLSEERRKEMVKICKKLGEDTRIKVRGIRREGNDELKRLQKDSKITEDILHQSETEIQKITDREIKTIDTLLQKKEEEILEI